MLSPRLLKDLKGRSSCSTLPLVLSILNLWMIQRFFVAYVVAQLQLSRS